MANTRASINKSKSGHSPRKSPFNDHCNDEHIFLGPLHVLPAAPACELAAQVMVSPCRGFFTVLLPSESASSVSSDVCGLVAKYRPHLAETSRRMALLNGSSFTLFLPASTSLGQPCFSEPLPFITEVRFDPRRVLESAGFGSSQVEQVLNWSSVPHEGLERTSDVLRLALAASHSLAYQDLDIFDLGRPMPSGPWATAWTGPTTIPNSNTTNASRDVARKAQTYHWSNAAFCLTRPQAVALMGAARVLLRKGETGTTGYRYMEFGPELFQTALQPNTLVPFPGPPVRPRLMLRGQLPPCVQPRITCENEWAQLAQADQRQSCPELLHLTCKSSHRLLACHSDGQRLISRFVAPAASRTPPRMAPVGSWGACLVGVVRRKTLPPLASPRMAALAVARQERLIGLSWSVCRVRLE